MGKLLVMQVRRPELGPQYTCKTLDTVLHPGALPVQGLPKLPSEFLFQVCDRVRDGLGNGFSCNILAKHVRESNSILVP